jgi:hypothetical protein
LTSNEMSTNHNGSGQPNTAYAAPAEEQKFIAVLGPNLHLPLLAHNTSVRWNQSHSSFAGKPGESGSCKMNVKDLSGHKITQ